MYEYIAIIHNTHTLTGPILYPRPLTREEKIIWRVAKRNRGRYLSA